MMNFINEWKGKIAQYIDVQLKLIKLNFIEQTSRIFGYFIFTMIGFMLGFAILIYLGLALAEWFTVLANGSRIEGFFMTVGFYVLLSIVIYIFRRPIIRAFANKMTSMLTEDNENEEK